MTVVVEYLSEQTTGEIESNIAPLHPALIPHVEALLAGAHEQNAKSPYRAVDTKERIEHILDPSQVFKPHIIAAILEISLQYPQEPISHAEVAEKVSEVTGVNLDDAAVPYVEFHGVWRPNYHQVVNARGVAGWAFAAAYYSVQQSILDRAAQIPPQEPVL